MSGILIKPEEAALAVAVLTDAREVIALPEHWTTEALARDSHGDPTNPRNSEAVCWCIMGALDRVSRAGMDPCWFATRYLSHVANGRPRDAGDPAGSGFTDWQDQHSHAEALALVDEAIELARAAAGELAP